MPNEQSRWKTLAVQATAQLARGVSSEVTQRLLRLVDEAHAESEQSLRARLFDAEAKLREAESNVQRLLELSWAHLDDDSSKESQSKEGCDGPS